MRKLHMARYKDFKSVGKSINNIKFNMIKYDSNIIQSYFKIPNLFLY